MIEFEVQLRQLEFRTEKLGDDVRRLTQANAMLSDLLRQRGGGGGGSGGSGSGPWLAKVITNITAASTRTAPGTGTVKRYLSFDGTNTTDLEADAVDCFNYHDKTFTASPESTVLVTSIYGVIWVLDAWSCTALSP